MKIIIKLQLKTIILLLLVFICGCHDNKSATVYSNSAVIAEHSYIQRTLPVYIDQLFSMREDLAIERGISNWNVVFKNQLYLSIVNYQFDMEPSIISIAIGQKAILILKLESTNPRIPTECNNGNCYSTIAWTNGLGGNEINIVADSYGSDQLEFIIMHEFGHLFGLKHSESHRSLMYRRFNMQGYSCVDQDSAIGAAHYLNIDTNHINYCIK